MAQDFRIKNRIQAINTIGKISRALQLVAISKLKKASKRIYEIRPYSVEMYDVFHQIINNTKKSIYLQTTDFVARKTLWIIINSNIGLCGGYNNNIHKLVLSKLQTKDLLIVIGSKGINYYLNREFNVIKGFKDFDLNFEYEKAQEIGLQVLSLFNDKKVDAIKLVYTKFINNITFEPTLLQLLPIAKQKNAIEKTAVLEFEPNSQVILERAISLYLNTIIYSSIRESQLSEQASRRLAMENATNNAKDLKEELTLHYNRSRQSKITQEISEIIAATNNTDENN